MSKKLNLKVTQNPDDKKLLYKTKKNPCLKGTLTENATVGHTDIESPTATVAAYTQQQWQTTKENQDKNITGGREASK